MLLKYLDCNRDLSIQVHPDDRRAAKLTPPDLGKTEAWYIIDAEPGAKLYAGLKAGVDRPALAAAIADGRILDCLHSLEPEPGACIFVPAGAVHALGHGLLVAEIQQASDTTYRLDDWGRVGPDGKPRALHVEAGLEATDYDLGPIAPQSPVADADGEWLVKCDKFNLIRHRLKAESVEIGGDGRFHILTIVAGEAEICEAGSPPAAARLGQSFLAPAASSPVRVTAGGDAVVLQACLPD